MRLLSVAPPVEDASDDLKFIRSRLRSIRAEAQGLDKALRHVEECASEANSEIRDAKVQAAVTDCVNRLMHNKPQVNEAFEKVNSHLRSNADAADQFSDEVTSIQNDWEEIAAGSQWPQQDQPTDQVLVITGKARDLLHNMIYHCALVTIPSRLNRHLVQLRVGQSLSFGNMFQDELSEESDRLKLLRYLSQHPAAVDGVIDVQKGLVYKAASNRQRRLTSYAVILLIALLGGALAYLLPTISRSFSVPGLPTDVSGIKLLFGYLIVLLGGIAHFGVDALKQIKQASTNSEPSMLAIEDWLTWIHIRELYVIAGVIALWFGFLGLVFYLKDIQFITAFLVGYSIDSFVDLFMQRFTTGIEKGTTELSNRLKARP